MKTHAHAHNRRQFLITTATAAVAGSLISSTLLAQQTTAPAKTRQSVFDQFIAGRLTANGTTADLTALPWNPHKDFSGVFLKNIITKEQTGGLMTCHLVRIDPGCAIGLHRHPASMELHEVIEGSGTCSLENTEIPYRPGSLGIMPVNSLHGIKAGADGIRLFAKFIIPPT